LQRLADFAVLAILPGSVVAPNGWRGHQVEALPQQRFNSIIGGTYTQSSGVFAVRCEEATAAFLNQRLRVTRSFELFVRFPS
jgi:hypothetical protein